MVKADVAEKSRLRRRYDEMFNAVHSEKLGELADEFDRVEGAALKVGALNKIIPPDQLRPYLIGAIERGMERSRLTGRATTATAPGSRSIRAETRPAIRSPSR